MNVKLKMLLHRKMLAVTQLDKGLKWVRLIFLVKVIRPLNIEQNLAKQVNILHCLYLYL